MSHDWPFMVITVRQVIYVRRRLGYPSFKKMISSSPACKVEYLKSLHREWQILAAISCVSHARECIPVHGYESCACYSLCHCWDPVLLSSSDTRKYVNLLPLKINSSSPRYVLCSLCKVGVHLS